MANWLRKLMPKEEKFFPLFNEHADLVAKAAEKLRVLLGAASNDGASELDGFVAQGRDATTRILDEIRHSFVTPFDRSDIKEMTSSMQSLLEDMQSVARSHANASSVKLDAFGQLIVDCAGELRAGVAQLQDFEKHADDLRRMRDKIAGLRTRMLVEREDAMLALLQHGTGDAMATLSASRLLQRVGDLVERFDEVADHIDDLVLDHV
jgi:uncharacterized protein Yka (UPF0111/DUF47 family)